MNDGFSILFEGKESDLEINSSCINRIEKTSHTKSQHMIHVSACENKQCSEPGHVGRQISCIS